MFNPDINDYQLTSIVTDCCGGMGVVYSAVHRPTNQQVAIKRYFVDKSKENASLIEQDVLIRKELNHANILPYLTSFVYGKDLYVISPLMAYGSCRDILDQYYQEGLPELVCAIILRDVLLALQYLHKQHYIHRGVSGGHVLVGPRGAVVSGLGSAGALLLRGRRRDKLHALPPPDHNHTNLMWLSPELLEQNLKGYDESSDIYSLGVLSCELANGGIPFGEVATTLMFTEKVRGSRPQLLDCSTFPEPTLEESDIKNGSYSMEGDAAALGRLRALYSRRKLSDNFHHLTDHVLQRDPEKRPTASQLLNYPFFKQIRKADYLPNLLSRAKPIKLEPDDMSALLLQEKMSDMDIEKATEWDF